MYLVNSVPEGLDKRPLVEFLGPDMPCAYLLMTSW